MDQAGRLTRKNLNKTALCETAQHRTKQHLLKSQFSPARHDLGAQAQRAAEALGCSHGLLGGLTVDVEHAREGEDKVATLRQRHANPRDRCLRRWVHELPVQERVTPAIAYAPAAT